LYESQALAADLFGRGIELGLKSLSTQHITKTETNRSRSILRMCWYRESLVKMLRLRLLWKFGRSVGNVRYKGSHRTVATAVHPVRVNNLSGHNDAENRCLVTLCDCLQRWRGRNLI